MSATVPPFFSFNAIQNVSSYEVKSDDIRRGYIDLPNALTVTMRSNLSTGVPVRVEHSGGGGVQLRECGTSAFLGTSFTVRNDDQRAAVPTRRHYDSRILLSTDAKEGTYQLVLSLYPTL